MKPHLSILEEERLAEEVRKYPCLYDKQDAGYKEKDRKKNAWRKVEESVGYEEGKSQSTMLSGLSTQGEHFFFFSV